MTEDFTLALTPGVYRKISQAATQTLLEISEVTEAPEEEEEPVTPRRGEDRTGRSHGTLSCWRILRMAKNFMTL